MWKIELFLRNLHELLLLIITKYTLHKTKDILTFIFYSFHNSQIPKTIINKLLKFLMFFYKKFYVYRRYFGIVFITL